MFLCSSFKNENVRASARFNPFELLPGVEEWWKQGPYLKCDFNYYINTKQGDSHNKLRALAPALKIKILKSELTRWTKESCQITMPTSMTAKIQKRFSMLEDYDFSP